jgi:hypothetical protein
MKCPKCGSDNRSAAKQCGRCGARFDAAAAPPKAGPTAPSEPLWKPDWRWHLRALAAVYIFLFCVYLGLNLFLSKVPEPYRMRDIPPEMTPWLKK